ncbi:MAG: hypothetical protein K1X35_11900 [Caulobacteraceae bacterium]|nr:hypothetical protein [Caulobacteraceae bacterium]
MHRRKLLCGLAGAPLLAAVPARAQSEQSATPLSGIEVTAPRVKPVIEPYTIEELFRPAPALDADLSADGKHVALIVDSGAEQRRQTEILVFSADDPTKGEARISMGDVNTHWIAWAGSDRVLVGVSGSSPTNLARRSGSFTNFAERRRELPYRRVMSVPLDGSGAVQLFQPAAGPHLRIPPEKFRRVLNLAEVVSVLDSNHALMAAFDREDLTLVPQKAWLPRGVYIPGPPPDPERMSMMRPSDSGAPLSGMTLYNVDLATGEPHEVIQGSARTYRWEAQGGRAILRRDIEPDGKHEVWRTLDGSVWRPVRTVDRADPDIVFMAASDQPGKLWVLARSGAETVKSVRLWDSASNTMAPPVSARPDREPLSVLFDAESRFLLASYRGADGLEHDTPDVGLKSILSTLRVQFGAGSATRVMHVDPSRAKVLLEVSGPELPRAFYLFDLTRRRLADIGGGPRLLPERLADAEPVSVAKTGGGRLQGLLTSSLQGAPGPLVVVLQSAVDPDTIYSFDPLAQLFATRGWWTLRLPDPANRTDVEALTGEAIRRAGLDASRTALIGLGEAALDALQDISRSWRAAIAFNSPESEGALLAGGSITARKALTTEAIMAGKPVLVVRNWGDARNARQSDQRVANALLQNDAGGLAEALYLGENGDADWNRLSTQIDRARLTAEFLDRVLR